MKCGGEAAQLKAIISQMESLSHYAENGALLEIAIQSAVDRINQRRGYRGEGYESKYRSNVIRGAIDYLERLGGNELASYSENGISGSYNEIPSWLSEVIPKLGVYK